MKIAIYGADSFLGSVLSNYLIQLSDADILGIPLCSGPWPHLEPSVRSKMRFSMQTHVDGNSGSTRALLARLAAENIQRIVFAERFSADFEGRADTILVTSSPEQTGAHRTLLIPNLYGPRQLVADGVAKLAWSAITELQVEPSGITKSYIYTKDMFDEVVRFLEGSARFVAAPGTACTESAIMRYFLAVSEEGRVASGVPVEMHASLDRTIAWYRANTWMRKVTNERI